MKEFLQAGAALANPVWESLSTKQAEMNAGDERLRYFPEAVAPFIGLPVCDEDDLRYMAEKTPHGRRFFLMQEKAVVIPEAFDIVLRLTLYQMICRKLVADEAELPLVDLGEKDIPAMLELTRLTKPGPFYERTISFGNYVGAYEANRLVAMGGERLKVPGYAEVSAICTHPEFRGRKLARGILSAVARRISDRGEVPFLHTKTDNDSAIRVYESLGFEYNREIFFAIISRK